MRRKETIMTESKNERTMIECGAPVDYENLMNSAQALSDRYPFLSVTYMGTSILGRGIPMLSIGEGRQKGVMYVGCHHGMEWITSAVLLKFIGELCESVLHGRKTYGINTAHMLRSRTVHVIPQLNVDGANIQIHGAEDCILRERLLSMNGSEDFSHWQANARGVDLNHNYDAGFYEYKKIEAEAGILGGCATRFSGESPESEPEVASLCSLLRFSSDISMVLTLHSQGEEIYYSSGGMTAPKSVAAARVLSRLSGYKLEEAEGMASYGGLTDWCIRSLNIPSFTIECGKGENPLPISDFPDIYSRLREALFTAPILS